MKAGIRLPHRRAVGWLLGGAFAANVFLMGFALVARAEAETTGPGDVLPDATEADGLAAAGEDRLRQVMEHLVAELRRKESELNARLGQVEAREAQLAGREAAPQPAAVPPAGESAGAPAAEEDPFDRLVAAFEKMEPDSAAAALMPLYERDSQAALRLILAVSTRQAGAVLDALAGLSPATAAAFAHDIHARSLAAESAGTRKNLPGGAEAGGS